MIGGRKHQIQIFSKLTQYILPTYCDITFEIVKRSLHSERERLPQHKIYLWPCVTLSSEVVNWHCHRKVVPCPCDITSKYIIKCSYLYCNIMICIILIYVCLCFITGGSVCESVLWMIGHGAQTPTNLSFRHPGTMENRTRTPYKVRGNVVVR